MTGFVVMGGPYPNLSMLALHAEVNICFLGSSGRNKPPASQSMLIDKQSKGLNAGVPSWSMDTQHEILAEKQQRQIRIFLVFRKASTYCMPLPQKHQEQSNLYERTEKEESNR